MASSLTGAGSFYAAQQAGAAAVPPSPRPLKVVSWNTGPAAIRGGTSLLGKLRTAGVAESFDVILLQELPGQWANPMAPEKVKQLLHKASPSYCGVLVNCVRLAFASCAFCVLRVLRVGCLRFGRFALWRVLPGFRLAISRWCL